MVIVQFYVGEDIERSLVKLYNEINKHMDEMPQGVTQPLVKTRAIDDVPMLGLTLWSENYSDYQLSQIAQELEAEIKKLTDYLSDPELYTLAPVKFQKASEALTERQDALDKAEIEWLELEERIVSHNS